MFIRFAGALAVSLAAALPALAEKGSAGPSVPTGAPAAAPGGLLTAGDPQALLATLQGAGYAATLGADGWGDPKISVTGDVTYDILFYGCENNVGCEWLLFTVGYDLDVPVDPALINEWNLNQLVGQAAYDDEGDPFLFYFVTLTGGVSAGNFLDSVEWFDVQVATFQESIGW